MSQQIPMHIIPRRDQLAYVEPYTEERLSAWRRKGDPLSDAVIEQIAQKGSLQQVHNLLGEVEKLAAAGNPEARAFLDFYRDVPAWVDFDSMRKGQELLAAFPFQMGLSLFSGSLCGGAVFTKMALITSMTGMLSGDSTRRLTETTKMVVSMAFPEAIRPGGSAYELLIRVRLLHSAIRRSLVESGRFKHPTEVPINQHDLAITLGLFGYLNIRSLGRLGVTLRDEDVESYIHMWRYGGYLLGIEDELLPDSIHDQQAFFLASLKHQAQPEKLSPATKLVLDNVARTFSGGETIVYPHVRQFLHQSCRYLSGNEYVTGMQIEDLGDNYWALRLLRGVGRVQSAVYLASPLAASVLYRIGRANYAEFLRRSDKNRDKKGEYRVRFVEGHASAPSPA